MTAEIDEVRRRIDAHLFTDVVHERWVQHVEYDPEIDRWYVRFTTDDRDAATIYLTLRERTLQYELFFLPAPPVSNAAFLAWLLRRNREIYGARFSVGDDGDVYLDGRIALEHCSITELDRILGVLYECTDLWFAAAARLAFGH
ncbi:MAG: YbjN domain-containing protein [Acidimicrobiia bacterium]